MNLLHDELLKHHNFLKLTRENPLEMSGTLQYYRNNLTISLLDTGVLVFEPEQPGKTDIVISSGIHGNETAPIEICELLVREILDGKLKIHNRVLFIIGNPQAMNNGNRFEIENLNRLFCGKHQGKSHAEARRAKKLEQLVGDFFLARQHSIERCHFDLHTAIRASKFEKFAIYPFQDGREWKKEYINFFNKSEINTILLAHQPAGTFSYYSSHEFNANAFTVELGKVKPFGENDMSSFSGIIGNLRQLISNTYVSNENVDNSKINLFKVVDEVFRHSESEFKLNISSKVANFTQFSIGFQLTTDDNGGYQMKSEKHAIVFPNAEVPVGQRVALIVENTNS